MNVDILDFSLKKQIQSLAIFRFSRFNNSNPFRKVSSDRKDSNIPSNAADQYPDFKRTHDIFHMAPASGLK
jgi:hypothetical protein